MGKIVNMELKLTEEEVNVILQGLGELPAKVSINIITMIHTEYKKQSEMSKNT